MHLFLLSSFEAVQFLYLLTMLVSVWFYVQPVNEVDRGEGDAPLPSQLPKIVMLYPVLRELEETMRTTFIGMAKADYPVGLIRVVAIPNHDDRTTVAALRRLQAEFDFLELMPVPPTSDASWDIVWSAWDANPKAYWWHHGIRAHNRALPPKKTRQMIWAFYQLAATNQDALLSYIDADSVVPEDYWRMAAIGMQKYDVLQNTNITGNLLATWPASFYALDHICWDATMYRHMSANGKHPFWVLGKGLFFRFSDLIDIGGFHPWITIEDPEIGMRLWTNGARLGIIESPLVEEVPATWLQGITQRKRWVAGFYQSLARPLTEMGMPLRKRMRARLNFVPCASLMINPIGFATGGWALVAAIKSTRTVFPPILVIPCAMNVVIAAGLIAYNWSRTWTATANVLPQRADRVRYALRVNPLFMLVYWLWWTIPLVYGLYLYLTDGGHVWERTEKIDANHELIRDLGDEEQPRGSAIASVPVSVGASLRVAGEPRK